jgi:hypothetical protein
MRTGVCVRCGAFGPVERDHPDGRESGRPLLPAVVTALCRPCHLAKGRWDRAANVEGGPASVSLLLARRAVWFSFLVAGPNAAEFVALPSYVVRDLVGVLEICAGLVPADLVWDPTWRA